MIETSSLSQDELSIYNKLSSRLPSTITDSDLATYTALLSILLSSFDYKISEFYRNLDVERADEFYLRLMADLVGYTWIESINVEANRSRLMYHFYKRKYRGTIESIKNLIRTSFSEEFFYSNAENPDIKVQEGYPLSLGYIEDDSQGDENLPVYYDASTWTDLRAYDYYNIDLYLTYAHMIMVNLPDDLVIFRSDIDEVRPAGTLIYFAYRLLFKLASSSINVLGKANTYSILINNSDGKLDRLMDLGLSTKLSEVSGRSIVLGQTAPLYTKGMDFVITIT